VIGVGIGCYGGGKAGIAWDLYRVLHGVCMKGESGLHLTLSSYITEKTNVQKSETLTSINGNLPPRRSIGRQGPYHPLLFSLIVISQATMLLFSSHILIIQCTHILNSIAVKIAQGIEPSIIRLALTPNAKAAMEAAVIADTKIGVWYRSVP